MTASALRVIAGAGVLVAGLFLAAPALAQTDDSTGGDGVDTTVTDADGDSEQGPSSLSPRPTSTVGDGRNGDVSADRVGPVAATPGRVSGSPSPRDVATPARSSAFFDAWEIPFVALNDMLRALAQPKPKPPPAPAFRMQEEPPVIDAAPAPRAGGSDPVADTPRPFRVPLVTAPRLPMGSAPRIGAPEPPAAPTPAGATGAAGPAPAGVPRPAAGHGGQAAVESATVAQPAAPLRVPGARGYPEYLRTPTAGELSLAALPGVAGLAMFTVGGGVIGYRQANSSRLVRNANIVRYLP